MDKSVLKRTRANTALGGTLITLGLLTYSFALYLFLSSPTPEVDVDQLRTQVEQNCKKVVDRLGFVSTGRSPLIISEGGLSDPYEKLARATVAIQSCLGYELREFCLGTACNVEGATGGLRMTLAVNLNK